VTFAVDFISRRCGFVVTELKFKYFGRLMPLERISLFRQTVLLRGHRCHLIPKDYFLGSQGPELIFSIIGLCESSRSNRIVKPCHPGRFADVERGCAARTLRGSASLRVDIESSICISLHLLSR